MKKCGFTALIFILMLVSACGNLSGNYTGDIYDSRIYMQTFYSAESEKYDFSSMSNLSSGEIKTYYQGTGNIEFEDQLVYTSGTDENKTEIALFKVKEAVDLEDLVYIIYLRKDEVETTWQSNKGNCDIAINNNYVLFVVNQHASDISDDFDELFDVQCW
ncbi:MAG: hypothetical protein R2876_01770 [Eubacteriales bacterium]